MAIVFHYFFPLFAVLGYGSRLRPVDTCFFTELPPVKQGFSLFPGSFGSSSRLPNQPKTAIFVVLALLILKTCPIRCSVLFSIFHMIDLMLWMFLMSCMFFPDFSFASRKTHFVAPDMAVSLVNPRLQCFDLLCVPWPSRAVKEEPTFNTGFHHLG